MSLKTHDASSLIESITALSEADRRAVVMSLPEKTAAALLYDWELWARPNQLPPPGDYAGWLILAGRGWGKNRTAAEYVISAARSGLYRHIGLIAETAGDARDVMIEGEESGILRLSPPWFYPKYEPSKRRLTWPNGVWASTYSGDEPGQLRGPQHSLCWPDEACKWRYLQEAWSNMEFGLRIGPKPHWVATTSPRPLPWLRQLMADANVVVTRGTTYENLVNLSPAFRRNVVEKHEGTRLGRQELNAEVLDDVPGALWTRDVIERNRVRDAPDMARVVVAVDPAASSDEEASETGIVVCGLGVDRQGYVLADLTCRLSPDGWARRVVDAFDRFDADRVVAEINNGGEMVETVIRTVRRSIPYKAVHASRGKVARAEPVAALDEQNRIHHVGMFAEMEDQMCGFVPGQLKVSPDRVDARVWGFHELMLKSLKRTPFRAAAGGERTVVKEYVPR